MNRRHMPITFLVYNLSETHYCMLLKQTIWASQNITFHISTPPMKCPTFLFTIKGLHTLEPNTVRETIRETWNNGTTQSFIQDGLSPLEGEKKERARQAIVAFMNSMWTTCLDTRDRGGILQPVFNVYAEGSIIDDITSWVNIRAHLADLDYYSSKLGHGHAEIAPFHCSLCHGVDHPRGLCPFPAIEGWHGPKRKLLLSTLKKGTTNCNGTRMHPSGWA
jgi:hypothetical protein